jgi:cytoskeletal protein CcmA (bactofilin family)
MKRRHIKGSVELVDGSVTVGPDGRVRAHLQARHIVVQGRVDGKPVPHQER